MMEGANSAGCLHGSLPARSCGHDEDVPALPLEMPERYNYCYQCGEYVGGTATLKPALSPEAEAQQQQQERVIHYGCLTLIVLWIVFGLWFCFHMNR